MSGGYLILDCYVDEPACFGVPPFLSPYPRYIYGALVDAGIDPVHIDYVTIDMIRGSHYIIKNEYRMVLLIGGAAVPGKYLGYRIGTVSEINTILQNNSHLEFAIGGLVAYTLDDVILKKVHLCTNDIEKFAYEYARGSKGYGNRTYEELNRWAAYGAHMVTQHPDFPHLVCEIETYRGCPRRSHCSFCSESIHSCDVQYRNQLSILTEVDTLIKMGISRFRIGRQADIIAYKSTMNEFTFGFPKPEVSLVASLFKELQSRKEAGQIKILNVDNANPGTIFHYPRESSQIIEAIAHAVTPDDTLPLGVESFDTTVIKKNNLKLPGEQVKEVVRLINESGGFKTGGQYTLLPGINLIHGLPGETAETFKINYNYLKEILDEGLLLKRINIRSILPFPGTPAAADGHHISTKIRNRYDYYRQKIREDIDHTMLQRIYPTGTILRDVRIEERHHDHSLGRQLKSYAIAIRIPLPVKLKEFLSVIITGQRERSLTGLPHPIVINLLPKKALEIIPGISKTTASDIVLKRPFASYGQVEKHLSNVEIDIRESIKAGFQ